VRLLRKRGFRETALGVRNEFAYPQHGDYWWALVNTKCWEFLDWMSNCRLLKENIGMNAS
jgi:hypothetical protein